MTSYRLIGQATTNGQGIASLTYTGVGGGELDIIASTDSTITSDSLLSNEYVLMDCIRYDCGKSSNYTDLFSTMSCFTRNTNDTTYYLDNSSSSSNDSNYLSSQIDITDNIVIEMEITSITTDTARIGVSRYGTGVSNTYNNMLINSARTLRIEITPDTTYWYSNGVLSKTDTNQPSDRFNFMILTMNGTISNFNYNELKIYPI